MKKLYRKGTVHPSPSPSPSIISDPFSLSYLPAAILTLAAALSAADKEVLSYLLSADKEKPKNKKSSPNHHHHHQHSPCFTCYCFNCYTTYWSRWDSSPNRQLIHEIIDAFEEALLSQRNNNNISNKNNKQGLTRREKRKNRGETGDKRNNNINNSKGFDLDLNSIDNGNKNGSDGSARVNPELGRPESERETGGQLGNGDDETGEKQGSVRKIVSFIGERIWGTVWG